MKSFYGNILSKISIIAVFQIVLTWMLITCTTDKNPMIEEIIGIPAEEIHEQPPIVEIESPKEIAILQEETEISEEEFQEQPPMAEPIAEPIAKIEAPEEIKIPVTEVQVKPAAPVAVVPREKIEIIPEQTRVPIAEIKEPERPITPLLIVPSPQEVVYNGEIQRLSYKYEGRGIPNIVYFATIQAWDENRESRAVTPVNAGTYYARVKYPQENINSPKEDIYAEFRILKQPVEIKTEKLQNAYYDGDPKRVQATSEPIVSLSYSYYPNRELMDNAVRNVARATNQADSVRSLTNTYRGYRRVESAPIERGTYYVWIYYPGNENLETAHEFVEFTILPPRAR